MRSDAAFLEPGVPAGPGAIGLCEPNIGGNEWAYIKQCLDSGWVSSAGSFVERFERELAAAVGARHAVAVGSGTAALHVALLVSGIGPDEEVVVPALTFIAPANAVRYVGAWPAFIDVEPDHWQMDPRQLEAFLREDCRREPNGLVNTRTGRRVTAVLPVDILGHPCDLDPILRLAAEFDLRVIEDATESLGAQYRGRPLGQWSPVSCFSFNGNKLITTGGGGMLVTDDERMATRARYLATQGKDDPVEYVHHAVAYNYRLTNVQAALGVAQLERLSDFLERKRAIADRYTTALAGLPGLTRMREASWARSAWWMFTVLLDPAAGGRPSRSMLRALAAEGIQARPLWQPLHRSPAHRSAFARACPNADTVQRLALSLPSSTGLSPADQDRVIEAIARHSRHAGACPGPVGPVMPRP
jgi:perosamine synthetase